MLVMFWQELLRNAVALLALENIYSNVECFVGVYRIVAMLFATFTNPAQTASFACHALSHLYTLFLTLNRPHSLQVSYMTLDCLQEHGLAANDIQKLNDAGYHTVESVAHATARKLADVKGISEAKVQKIKDIVKAMVCMDFKTAADALEDRK